MTMMFAKFNKLLRSRLLWAAFCIIISIAFVGLFTTVPEQNQAAREARSVGTLNGKPVPADEYRNAYMNTYLSLAIRLGRAFSPSRLDEQLRREAWRRLITLRRARELGMTVSEREIVEAIRQQPMFTTEDGRFNPRAYQGFIQNVMARQFGVSPIGFEQHIEQEILLNRMRNMVSQSILVAPMEQQRAFRTLSDTFTVHTLTVTEEALTNDVTLTEQEIQDFFTENIDAFTIPEQVQVNYVRIPISNLFAEIEIAEDDALTFYEANIDRYTQETEPIEDPEAGETAEPTNDADLAESMIQLPGEDGGDSTGGLDFAEFETDESEPITVTIPFEDVREEIEAELTREEARMQAAEKATDIMVALTPDRRGNAPDIHEVARSFDLEVLTTRPLSRDDQVADVEAEEEFLRAAFELQDTPDLSYSDVIVGENYVYVQSLVERIPPRRPEFEEVADEVREAALARAQDDALRDRAAGLRDMLETKVSEGAAFSNVVAGLDGLITSSPEPFSVMSGLEEVPNAEAIISSVIASEEGDISEPRPLESGYFMVYIRDRAPTEDISLGGVRPQIVRSLRRDRIGRMFTAFQEYLLEQAGFEPKSQDRPAEPEEDEEQAA